MYANAEMIFVNTHRVLVATIFKKDLNRQDCICENMFRFLENDITSHSVNSRDI